MGFYPLRCLPATSAPCGACHLARGGRLARRERPCLDAGTQYSDAEGSCNSSDAVLDSCASSRRLNEMRAPRITTHETRDETTRPRDEAPFARSMFVAHFDRGEKRLRRWLLT